MKKYIFKTTATMKPYNNKNWWIDGGIIPVKHIEAETVKDALQIFRDIVDEQHYISISDRALKNKNPMYRDTETGNALQVGYVITGKTEFQKDSGEWVTQYIDYGLKLLPLWKQSFERGGGYIMTDYNKIAMDNLNGLMREIAEYSRMAEEIGATLDSLKDSLKKYMDENGLDSIAGNEHKASYKAVTSSRIDTTALKRDMPEIAAKYTKTTETRRFLFV